MKILAKLLTGFIAVAVLCSIVGVVGIIQISNQNKNLQDQNIESTLKQSGAGWCWHLRTGILYEDHCERNSV